ncbi:translation initiation factor IF-2-like [Cervus elaphus]|uniref:translation initiation factor IF-2-like n=1 Tax=Cervus elaphus TaxID=9860 RepID=UPI001CC2E7B2|nr:translation initiation factor IF-2-like [Cervus elaphus]
MEALGGVSNLDSGTGEDFGGNVHLRGPVTPPPSSHRSPTQRPNPGTFPPCKEDSAEGRNNSRHLVCVLGLGGREGERERARVGKRDAGLSDPQPPPARTHPHRGPGAGPASTPKGGPLHNPAPRGAFARRRGRPRAEPRGAGAPGTWPLRVGAVAAAVFIYFFAGGEGEGRESAAREEAACAARQKRGLLGGLGVGAGRRRCSARPPSALWAGELRARRPRRASAARCEAVAPAWLSARASSLRPLGAGAAAARSAAARGGGGGFGGWGLRSGRGHREEVSVSCRLLLSPLFAPASLWR